MKYILKILLLIHVTILFIQYTDAQPLQGRKLFTHADTLRGTYGPGRDWWDVLKYDLHVKFNINDSTISGYNIISLKVLKKGSTMQIDLQPGLTIDSIIILHSNGYRIVLPNHTIIHEGDAYLFPVKKIRRKDMAQLIVYYHGKPRVAVRPPWDGGLIWKTDKNNNPWISVACQGLGASVWYPCKDHQIDEPDSAEMHITIPDSLFCVGNGRFRGKITDGNGTATYRWAVSAPINNYNLVPYIGKYVHFNEIYKGEKGNLDMDYWVLDYNAEKAKKQFADAPRMMKAFEHWFGPYPFYEDGFKLVEAPHLGMEHQSAIAYGNSYQNGYMGKDLSGSGWGLKWDFIIVHESGHEWFANNITTKDVADMWVHEGFTNYSETLFTEYYYGIEAGNAYSIGNRTTIQNDIPIIGPYGVNQEGSGDMYNKAGNMLHTIRQVINDDEKFRQILRGLNKEFYHKTVTGKQVQDYINKKSGINFNTVFEQYLATVQIPVLEYKVQGHKLSYRYTNCVKGFNLPLKIIRKTQLELKQIEEDKLHRTLSVKNAQWIKPTETWKETNLYPEDNFSVDSNFYIKTKRVD